MKPKISYIICAMPRSGTHFLGERLANTGRAGKPDEYFICDHEGRLENERGNIAEIYGQKTLPDFRDLVIELGSTPNGVFGITIMWSYFHTILANYRTLPRYREMGDYELLQSLLYDPRYIWLIRRDKVRQAVSLSKAIQTNIWKKPGEGKRVEARREPEFNFHAIEHYRRRLEEADKRWDNYFETHGIQPFRVVYEEFVKHHEETTRAILAYLHIPAADLDFTPPRLQKQSDETSDQWVARYHEIKESRAGSSFFSRSFHYVAGKIAALRQHREDGGNS